ncbi:NAD(P)-dependent oxidoreductase [Rhodococcus sp. X156]|uniref:SDR family oxidoreductase n=1 Tax=Rhodococcus sp. X156 TaxID=2499145 RepID=UPI000FD70FA9|nr:NAD(P)-dependent oxidoreductase [Rhodococcus sp. X156]
MTSDGHTDQAAGSQAPGSPAQSSLRGRTIVMSGGSRGIGLAIALRAAREGANVALMAKTAEADPRLPGTVYSAAEEIRAAGGQALPVVGDVRNEEDVQRVVEQAVAEFGGIDVVVNNASAINLSGTVDLPMKRFDLMQQINVRGTFLLTKYCIPHLAQGTNPHILTLSPPVNMDPKWLGGHPAYTLSKYGMTLLTLGWATELAEQGIAANALWPRTIIATAAVQNLLGGDESIARSRSPEIVADAAHVVLTTAGRTLTGQTLIDDEVLASAGVTDLSQYSTGEESELAMDIFLD